MQPLYAEIGTGVAILIGLGAVVVIAMLYFVGIFNGLVELKNRFKNAWPQIDVQLKRRTT